MGHQKGVSAKESFLVLALWGSSLLQLQKGAQKLSMVAELRFWGFPCLSFAEHA